MTMIRSLENEITNAFYTFYRTVASMTYKSKKILNFSHLTYDDRDRNNTFFYNTIVNHLTIPNPPLQLIKKVENFVLYFHNTLTM